MNYIPTFVFITSTLIGFYFSVKIYFAQSAILFGVSDDTRYSWQPQLISQSEIEMRPLSEGKPILALIKWAHAVNSQRQLNAALTDERIDMLEADVVLGKLHGQTKEDDIPIMGHPPATTSDISLAMFLHQIMKYHKQANAKVKGVKLDFKTIEAFEMALPSLQAIAPLMTFPIWLNADILPGPVNATADKPVDAKRFLSMCASIKQAVLSVGWTTEWGATYRDGAYTQQHISDMFEMLKSQNITKTKQQLTFPVRAGIAANSQTELVGLLSDLNATNDCTLTVWSAHDDYVNIDKLRNVIMSIGLERVYLDVPEDLEKALHLFDSNAGPLVSWSIFLRFAALSVCLVVGTAFANSRT